MKAPFPKNGTWLIATALLASCFGVQAKCQLNKLNLQSGNERISIGALSLGEADNPEKPTAWQGPLKIDECIVDVGVIEQPLIIADGRYLLVTLYSGSTRQVIMVDPRSCTTRWTSPTFTVPPEIESNALRIDGIRVELDNSCMLSRRSDPAQ